MNAYSTYDVLVLTATFTDALSNGELFSLDMGLLKSANSTAIPWVDQKAAGFTTTNYDPVMVIADNHIYFIDVPGVAAGSAMIFVIHCMSCIFSHWIDAHCRCDRLVLPARSSGLWQLPCVAWTGHIVLPG